MAIAVNDKGQASLGFDNPLVNAADQGDKKEVLRLLQSGEIVDSRGDFGVTPLMRAAYRGDLPMVKLLVSAGADTDAVDLGGATALHLASRQGCKDVVEYLVKSGRATVNNKDDNGWTPLMRAVKNSPDIVKILLDGGADPTIKNRWGQSAVNLAISEESLSSASILVATPHYISLSADEKTVLTDVAKTKHNSSLIALLDVANRGSYKVTNVENSKIVDMQRNRDEVAIEDKDTPVPAVNTAQPQATPTESLITDDNYSDATDKDIIAQYADANIQEEKNTIPVETEPVVSTEYDAKKQENKKTGKRSTAVKQVVSKMPQSDKDINTKKKVFKQQSRRNEASQNDEEKQLVARANLPLSMTQREDDMLIKADAPLPAQEQVGKADAVEDHGSGVGIAVRVPLSGKTNKIFDNNAANTSDGEQGRRLLVRLRDVGTRKVAEQYLDSISGDQLLYGVRVRLISSGYRGEQSIEIGPVEEDKVRPVCRIAKAVMNKDRLVCMIVDVTGMRTSSNVYNNDNTMVENNTLFGNKYSAGGQVALLATRYSKRYLF
jgi:hypothetical protein